MSSVDVFAVGGTGESDRWEVISRIALTLDRDDFLPSGYKVSAIYKSMATTPTRSRVGARLSDRFESSPSKKRRTTPVDDVLVISDEDDDKGDDHDYDPDEEKEVDEKVRIDDDDLQELDPIQPNATLPERRSRVISQSAQASDNPPSVRTPGASSSGGRRRKRKDMDSVATVMESILAILADSQQRHEQQIAEINARQDRDRAESMRLFEESRRMHEDTSRMMLQQQQQTNLLLSAFSLPELRTVISDSRSKSFASSKQKQVSDPPVHSEGPLEDLGRPLRSRAVDKWLNVVLDFNGILCVCEDWKPNRST
uniref:Predicted protein n=1 Tax=Physcomitrium patens TaxID=3218 RepID=A9U5Y1_PHYPA